MALIGEVWIEIFLRPMLNALVLLYLTLSHNFGLGIIVFTLIVRVATYPLTVKQTKATRRMSEIQPRLQEAQKRYPNDPRRRQQETMRVYKELGVNPLGCLGPMVIQLPIWIALYQSILQALPTTPEALAGLSQRLYSWLPAVHSAVPFNRSFLWLDLAQPDPSPLVFPVLVGGSMWVMQKMMTYPTSDARQQSTNRMMLWMMPVMFGFLTLSFPSGLALYWFVSNLIGIGMQYRIAGFGNLFPAPASSAPAAAGPPDGAQAEAQPDKEIFDDGTSTGQARGVRQDNRRRHRNRPQAARRRARGGRGRGP